MSEEKSFAVEIWDLESRNLLAVYDDAATAHAILRAHAERYGKSAVEHLRVVEVPVD